MNDKEWDLFLEFQRRIQNFESKSQALKQSHYVSEKDNLQKLEDETKHSSLNQSYKHNYCFEEEVRSLSD